MTRKLILLSNDDGYDAAGLLALRKAITFADIVVCAPLTNQSAVSSALSLHRPLRLKKMGENYFAVDGTPADSIYVALYADDAVCPRRPDLVLSGMNHGPNLGGDVSYSGTVAAAREGAFHGLPAVAVSLSTKANYAEAARSAARLIQALLQSPLSTTLPPLLNVNIPQNARPGYAMTTLGNREFSHGVVRRKDPRGGEYIWIGGSDSVLDATPGTDSAAWLDSVVSVTSLQTRPGLGDTDVQSLIDAAC